MKWLGQYIQSFTARFRDDVYIENIGTTTETDMVVVDSAGLLSKRAIDAITVDVSDFMSSGSTGRVLTSSGADTMLANTYLTFINDAGEADTSTLSLISNQNVSDMFTIGTTTNGATTLTTTDADAESANLTFQVGGSMLHKPVTGTSRWYLTGNDDDYLNLAIGAHGDSTFSTVDAAAAAAHISFQPDGDLKLTPGSGTTYFYDSDNASDYLKLDIGTHGDAKFTTVDAALNNADFIIEPDGVFGVSPSRILSGTDNHTFQIGAYGVTQLASEITTQPKVYIKNTCDDDDAGSLILMKNREDGGTVQAGEDNDVIGHIDFLSVDDGGAGSPNAQTYVSMNGAIDDATSGQESGRFRCLVAAHDGTQKVGLQLTGGSVGSEVDVNVGLGASSVTAIAGDVTIGGEITSLGTRLNANKVGGGSVGNTEYNYLNNLTSNIQTQLDDKVDINGTNTTDGLIFTSANQNDPAITIQNTHNGATAARLEFKKDRGAAGVDGDDVGIIDFIGDDSAQTLTSFAQIKAEVSESLDTDEAGKLSLLVAESDGANTALTAGLVLEGEDRTDGQIDVTIAAGAASTTTIAGNLTVTGSISESGTRQIVNLKGYATLQDDIYDYAEDFLDAQAPWQLDKSYGHADITSSTEVAQTSLFRAGGFHVPFACTISALQVQGTCSGSGGGNMSIALVEYRPSELAADTNDYPRTVYETVVVASNNNNDKVKTVNGALDGASLAIPAGSHLLIMIKGDSTTAGDTGVVHVSIGLSW